MIQLSYAIGVSKPVSIYVNTYGTGKVDDDKLSVLLNKHIDLTPRGIVERLKLKRPIYKQTAAYGHFGRDEKDFTWEKLDLVSTLKKITK